MAKNRKAVLSNGSVDGAGGASASKERQKAEKSKSILREYLEVIIAAVILALFIRTFFVQTYKIPSGSMEPTLEVGDQILVSKFFYGIRVPFLNKIVISTATPKRGDVMVFIFPLDRSVDFIKRVVGIPGDTVEISNRKLYINGEPVKDEFARYEKISSASVMVKPRDIFGPMVVPENKYFVMGDNRDHSHDSRWWGFVDIDDVRGKAFLIHWSWKSTSWGVRWERIGHIIH
ncbi:MAG: signal peptidase I [Deltaproteobacteria bacterium]|nr:signal peptidase I [Deltaproteobacteria bacterium]